MLISFKKDGTEEGYNKDGTEEGYNKDGTEEGYNNCDSVFLLVLSHHILIEEI